MLLSVSEAQTFGLDAIQSIINVISLEEIKKKKSVLTIYCNSKLQTSNVILTVPYSCIYIPEACYIFPCTIPNIT